MEKNIARLQTCTQLSGSKSYWTQWGLLLRIHVWQGWGTILALQPRTLSGSDTWAKFERWVGPHTCQSHSVIMMPHDWQVGGPPHKIMELPLGNHTAQDIGSPTFRVLKHCSLPPSLPLKGRAETRLSVKKQNFSILLLLFAKHSFVYNV